MTASDLPQRSGRSLHDSLARWIEQRVGRDEIPRAADGWPDVEAWRDAAQEDGMPCSSEDVREAIRIVLLFRKVKAVRGE